MAIFLDLTFVPPPQFAVQLDHSVQFPQTQSTEAIGMIKYAYIDVVFKTISKQ